MDLRAETTVAAARDAVYRVNRDKLVELVPYLPNVVRIDVQSRADRGAGKIEMVNVWHGGGEIPAAVRSFLSSSMLSWTDYAEWDQETWSCAWRSESHSFREAVQSRGRNEFADAGGRTVIRINGKLDVDATKIPGIPRLIAGKVGKLVEAFLVKQVQDNLHEVGRGVDRYLRERGAPT
jgi:hypothetical protein